MPEPSHLPEAVFECTDLRSFNRLFFRLPEIRLYIAATVLSAMISLWLARDVQSVVVPVLLIFAIYPAFEYLLHRYVLHNNHLCRTPVTARIWWRIHFRHHSEPRDLKVILGAPLSLLFIIAFGGLMGMSLYWNSASFAAAFAASGLCVIGYEYVHSFQHSRVETDNRYLLRMRRHHLAHHFLSEQVNYGIATDVIDRLCGTILASDRAERSPTVYNLGYTGEMQRRYPYVDAIDHPPSPERRDQFDTLKS
jgi:sterol desaturase/sphingolipid hydroxylase (fatty acid hydroxylase superfamily)